MQKVTVDSAAEALGIAPKTLKRIMDDKSMDLGAVVQREKQKTYIISPKKLYEETGLKMGGYEPETIDYDLLADKIVERMKAI